MSQLSNATSRLTNWLVSDQERGSVSALTVEKIGDLQKDVAIVLENFNFADCRDARLDYTSSGGILIYLAWNLLPGKPQIVAVCSSEACAEQYRSFVEQGKGSFHTEIVMLDHAFGRNDMQSIAYQSTGPQGVVR